MRGKWRGRKVGTGYRSLLPAPTLPNCPHNCSAPSPESATSGGQRPQVSLKEERVPELVPALGPRRERRDIERERRKE